MRHYSKAFLANLIENFKLDPLTSVHGLAHWMRVMRNGMEIARRTPGVSTKVVQYFAILHDSERVADDADSEHGARAVDSLLNYDLDLTGDEWHMLTQAMDFHSMALTSACPTIAACWDADRLDLLRVGVVPSPHLLSTEYAKQPRVIDAACARALRWVNLNRRKQ